MGNECGTCGLASDALCKEGEEVKSTNKINTLSSEVEQGVSVFPRFRKSWQLHEHLNWETSRTNSSCQEDECGEKRKEKEMKVSC